MADERHLQGGGLMKHLEIKINVSLDETKLLDDAEVGRCIEQIWNIASRTCGSIDTLIAAYQYPGVSKADVEMVTR
jgi:hypothetical protein